MVAGIIFVLADRSVAIKLARTIADLASAEQIQPAHLVEALQYKPRMEIG